MRFAPALELSEDSISLYERRRRSRRRDSPSSRHVLRRFDRHVALTEGRRSWRYFEIPGPRLFSIPWGFVCRKSAQIPRSPGDGPPAGELSVHKALNSPEPIGRAWLGDLETFHAERRCYRASSALHCPEQENVRSQASSRQPKAARAPNAIPTNAQVMAICGHAYRAAAPPSLFSRALADNAARVALSRWTRFRPCNRLVWRDVRGPP
jgi:hypothetical protein